MARRRTVQRDPSGRIASTYEEEEEEDGILRDGQSFRVPLYMRDGLTPNPRLLPHQRAKATAARQHNQPLVTDATNNPMAMHRPGFRYLTDSTRRAISDAVKGEAYEEADEEAANARRGPSARLDYDEFTGRESRNTGTGAPGKGSGAPVGAYPLSAGEGTACTVNGAPGTLVRQGNGLVCQPRRSQDAATVDAKAQAYADYDREMANAWRSNK